MVAELAIRTATAAELPTILGLSGETAPAQLSQREQVFAPPGTAAHTASGMIMNALAQGGTILVAGDRGSLAGYVVITAVPGALTGAVEAQVLDIFVAPAYRRRGLGQHLLEAACNWAWSCGIRQVALMVSLHNQASLGNSVKAGFVAERVLFGKVLG